MMQSISSGFAADSKVQVSRVYGIRFTSFVDPLARRRGPLV